MESKIKNNLAPTTLFYILKGYNLNNRGVRLLQDS